MKGMNQMTTLTIHADDDLAAAVRTAAEQAGRSINVFLKEVIASSLGVSGKRPTTGISRRCLFCADRIGASGPRQARRKHLHTPVTEDQRRDMT